MQIFRSIRKIRPINKTIAIFLKKSYNITTKLYSSAIQRWPTSGVINCSFNDVEFKLNNACDDGLANCFYYKLDYNEDTDLKLFMQLAKHSKCILDIGANTGVFSILASKVNPNSEIHAFEPFWNNANRLKSNLISNNIKNVTVYLEAFLNQIGEIELTIPKDNRITDVASTNLDFSKQMYPELDWQVVKVKGNTVDNFRQDLDKPIDLIKCDVETAEMLVFSGAFDVLKNDRPTIIFESFLNDERIIFFNDILKNYNYHLYLILNQGLVACKEGFRETNLGLNYLISPIEPTRTYYNYTDVKHIKDLLVRPLF